MNLHQTLALCAASCAALGLSGCGGDSSTEPPASAPPAARAYRVARGFVRDPEGRAVILRGVNLANAHKHPPYFGPHTEADFARLSREFGMNSIRLLVSWSAVEPAQGKIDAAYLDALAERVAWAKRAGLLVVIDMHQDIYGEGFEGNGAPRWTCDEARYKAFVPAESWFFSYLDPNVIACFDGFWTSPSLQDSYADAAAAVARRVRDDEVVIGVDVMNEPFWGSQPTTTFEPDVLGPFYARVMERVRKESPSAIAFLEPAATRNLGLATRFERMPIDNAVYSPHAYDTTAEQGKGFSGPARSAYLSRIAAYKVEADDFGTPLWIGEYGGTSGSAGIIEYLDTAYEGAGKAGAGSMLWSYDFDGGYGLMNADHSDKPAILDVVVRPVPRRVAGDAVDYAFDSKTRVFTTSYAPVATVKAPTEIVAPARAYPQGFDVDCGGCAFERDGDVVRITSVPAVPRVTVKLTPR